MMARSMFISICHWSSMTEELVAEYLKNPVVRRLQRLNSDAPFAVADGPEFTGKADLSTADRCWIDRPVHELKDGPGKNTKST